MRGGRPLASPPPCSSSVCPPPVRQTKKQASEHVFLPVLFKDEDVYQALISPTTAVGAAPSRSPARFPSRDVLGARAHLTYFG